ncbi:hypothetical protein HFP47_04820 [Leuconostoc sp. DB-1]|uniref:hypothetical protein n=1 Tax=Leuconostoc sp. DB-1 TaxID=2724526 RepID=UPI0015CF1E16|nr:hypothetical protein [Leuconostoc sp. DB-1]NYS22364.1 hypothetical protein [Leuconostoc sp. DB-1]
MALAREDINFENIKREADVEMLVKNMVQTDNMIAHLKDEQFEMRNEIKEHKETISKLENDIQLLKKRRDGTCYGRIAWKKILTIPK